MSIPEKGEGPKTATKKVKKSTCTDFTQNREKSSLLSPTTLLPLLSQLGGNVSPGSGRPGPDPAELGPARAHSFHYAPTRNSRALWAPQPKSQGLLRREKKNQNPTPSHVHLPQQNSSETNLHRQPFLHNFESPNTSSSGASPVLPTAPQRVPTPRFMDALSSIGTVSTPREDATLKGRKGK